MHKYLLLGPKRKPRNEDEHVADNTLEKTTTDNTAVENSGPKKKPRGWDERWRAERPWLQLADGKMFCDWCRRYMSSNDKAHKSALIKGKMH